jgi:type II secretory pathway component PulM
MRQRHLTAEITELVARTSLVAPTGVRKCGSLTYKFRALGGHIFCVSVSEGKVQTQIVAISFLDLLEFIAIVKFVTEVLSVTEIMLRL